MTNIHVYEAIASVSMALSKEGITKSRKNQQQGYSFRGIDEVLNTLAPLMAQHKLVIIPRVIERESIERQTKSGGALFYTTVKAEFDFVSAVDGSKHTASTYGEAMDSADKSTNKAMSAAYKYAAIQTFCIPTEGDNDADATTHEVAPKPKPEKDPKEARLAAENWVGQQQKVLVQLDADGIAKWKAEQAATLKRLEQGHKDLYDNLMDGVG